LKVASLKAARGFRFKSPQTCFFE